MAQLKTISYGSTGPFVSLLELALRREGAYEGALDGIFGPRLLASLTNFQERWGLMPDGVAGPAVWRSLESWLTGAARYTVRPGDTLWSVSRSFGTTVRSVETANPGVDPLDLRPGTLLTVPRGFEVVSGEVPFTPAYLELCIRGLAARYPSIRSGAAGTSVMGRPLWTISFGEGANQVFYNASHHANEWITSPLLMQFLEKYARAQSLGGRLYGMDSGDLFRVSTLYMMPMVNPDGVALVTGELDSGRYYSLARGISADYPAIPFPGGWKANIRGVDPNLQYPAGWNEAREIKFAQGYVSPAPRDYVGSAPLEIPESRAVYNFTKNHDFSITLSYHTQGRVIYWKYADFDPPGALDIARRFAAVSGYSVELTPYASGNAGYKDWFIKEYGRPGFTIEAGAGTAPLALTQLPQIYAENEGILALGLTATA